MMSEDDQRVPARTPHSSVHVSPSALHPCPALLRLDASLRCVAVSFSLPRDPSRVRARLPSAEHGDAHFGPPSLNLSPACSLSEAARAAAHAHISDHLSRRLECACRLERTSQSKLLPRAPSGKRAACIWGHVGQVGRPPQRGRLAEEWAGEEEETRTSSDAARALVPARRWTPAGDQHARLMCKPLNSACQGR